MARNYPKFIYSNVTNVKSNGEFIMHTLEPAFLAKVVHGKKITMEVVQTYGTVGMAGMELYLQPILDRMVQWYIAVHLQESNAKKDIEGLKTRDAFKQLINEKGIAKKFGVPKLDINNARTRLKKGESITVDFMHKYLLLAGWEKVSEEMWIEK